MIKKLTYFLLSCLGLASCAIENDIPYPLRVASVSSIEVEGQRAAEGATDAAAVIDKAAGLGRYHPIENHPACLGSKRSDDRDRFGGVR